MTHLGADILLICACIPPKLAGLPHDAPRPCQYYLENYTVSLEEPTVRSAPPPCGTRTPRCATRRATRPSPTKGPVSL